MSGRTVLAVVVLAVVAVVILVAMARSWRARQTASTAALPPLPAVPTVPTELGAARTEALEAVYVSTTAAGEPLIRVPGHGLGVRAPARVQVHDAGVVVLRTGATDLFVPARDVVGVERTAGMAGKVVGGDRLVVLRWRLRSDAASDHGPDHVLDTGLHLRDRDDREALTAALRTLANHHEETA